jgi:hypothetical protein
LISWTFPRLLPDRWLDRLIGRNFGLLNTSDRQDVAQRVS